MSNQNNLFKFDIIRIAFQHGFMAHQRDRILRPLLEQSVGWSPITAVFGQRQVGKTTMLKAMSSSMETFDQPAFRQEFEKNGESILQASKKPLFLDEVQKYPPVFDLLKIAADRFKRPGQFLITGSVRFAQRKAVRESLTGRTTLWELLPLTTSELYSKPFRNLWKEWATDLIKPLSKESNPPWISGKQLNHLYETGGLPGICFLRSEPQRLNAFKNHLATLIERDLPLIRETKISSGQIMELLRLLVRVQGQPINLSTLARAVRLSSPSVKALLLAFEGLFLIRLHGRTLFFEDLGVSYHLDPHAQKEAGRQQNQWIFLELRAQVNYRAQEVLQFSEFRTRGGSYVPFVIVTRSGETFGVTYDSLPYPSQKSLMGLQSLKKKSKGRFRGIAFCQTDEPQTLESGFFVLPLRNLV